MNRNKLFSWLMDRWGLLVLRTQWWLQRPRTRRNPLKCSTVPTPASALELNNIQSIAGGLEILGSLAPLLTICHGWWMKSSDQKWWLIPANEATSVVAFSVDIFLLDKWTSVAYNSPGFGPEKLESAGSLSYVCVEGILFVHWLQSPSLNFSFSSLSWNLFSPEIHENSRCLEKTCV